MNSHRVPNDETMYAIAELSSISIIIPTPVLFSLANGNL